MYTSITLRTRFLSAARLAGCVGVATLTFAAKNNALALPACAQQEAIDAAVDGDFSAARSVGACLAGSSGPERDSIAETLQTRSMDRHLATATFEAVALHDHNLDPRIGSIFALGILDPSAENILPALNRCLLDPNPRIELAAVGILDRKTKTAYNKGTISALTQLTLSKTWQVRFDAIAALGMIGPDAGVGASVLASALKDRDTRIASAASASLARMGRGGTAAISALIWVLDQRQAAYPSEDDPTTLRNSIAALGAMGAHASRAVPVIVKQLGVLGARIEAAKALGEIGDQRAIPALQRALKQPESGNAGLDADFHRQVQESLLTLGASKNNAHKR